MSMKRYALVFLAAFISCTETNNIQLTFGENGEGLDGFVCRDTSGEFLLNRIQSRVTTVVDFIATGGFPGCRGSQIRSWCDTPGRCRLLEEHRYCEEQTYTDVELPSSWTEEQAKAAVSDVLVQSAFAITSDAPDGWILVRVVTTTQSCAEIASGLSPAALVGCAYASPARLDTFRGKLFLGFDTVGGCNGDAVTACATDFFD